MTAMERAHTYAAIFIGVGENWRNYVPCDALSSITDTGVHIGGVAMEYGPNGWRLTEDDNSIVVRRKASA